MQMSVFLPDPYDKFSSIHQLSLSLSMPLLQPHPHLSRASLCISVYSSLSVTTSTFHSRSVTRVLTIALLHLCSVCVNMLVCPITNRNERLEVGFKECLELNLKVSGFTSQKQDENTGSIHLVCSQRFSRI